MVGEMCPQGAGGRPAVSPLVMRGVGWEDTPAEVMATVERGSVPRMIVFGLDGKPAGTFDTMGLADVGVGQSVATGSYAGSAPCSKPATDKAAARVDDPKCIAATRGCGIAVGEITSPDEPGDMAPFPTGGGCMSGNELAVDIDGDGRIESFPIAGALDGIRAPAQEWTASATSTASCTPTFQIYDLKLLPEARPGRPPEKAMVTLDLLAVADLDGDGRKELVISMKFPTSRSIVVYTATASSQRLELAGEGQSSLK